MKSLKDILNQYRPLSAEASQQFNQVRGFSTVAVVLCHAYLIFLYPIYPAIMMPIYLLAHACVMALFALSGFLICQSACNNIQQNGQFIIQKYVKARINRIVPPLYSACGFLLLLYWLSPFVFASGNREFTIISDTMSQANMSLNTESLLGILFFVNGFITETPASNFAFWSLSFEAWFYILFGLLLLPNRKIDMSFALLCLIILSALNYVFLLYVCIWIAGAMAALLYNHQYRLTLKQTTMIVTVITIMLMSAAYFGLIIFKNSLDTQKFLLAIYGAWVGILLAVMLYLISMGRIRIQLPFQFVAPSSYTVYLLHFPLLLFIYGIIQPYIYGNHCLLILITLIVSILTITVSMIIGQYVEKIKLIP